MGRFCNGLMISFRILQLLLSLVVLGCGVYITYTMLSMSAAAKNIDSSIQALLNTTQFANDSNALGANFTAKLTQDDKNSLLIVSEGLTPILHMMEGVPVRAIIVAAIGLWSTLVIIYMLVAQKSTNRPGLNKRRVRITLELVTLIAWLAAITCAVLLTCQYGFIVLAGGVELKLAWTAIKHIIRQALESIFKSNNVLREISIVDDIVTTGALSILALTSAGICGIVSLVSSVMSCCVSGKIKGAQLGSPETGMKRGDVRYHHVPQETITMIEKPKLWAYETESPVSWPGSATSASTTLLNHPFNSPVDSRAR